MWQCGGSVEVLPCARIAHIERAHKPYTEDLTAHVRRNALRVAEVWMDEFKSHVYMAWNIPQEVIRSHTVTHAAWLHVNSLDLYKQCCVMFSEIWHKFYPLVAEVKRLD